MSGRILVGGGSGFIGKEVVRLFERLDYEVIVISRSNVRVKPRPLEGFREYNPVPKKYKNLGQHKGDIKCEVIQQHLTRENLINT